MLRLQAEKKVFARQAVSDITPADAAARLVCMSEEGQVGRVWEGLLALLLYASLPEGKTGLRKQQQPRQQSIQARRWVLNTTMMQVLQQGGTRPPMLGRASEPLPVPPPHLLQRRRLNGRRSLLTRAALPLPTPCSCPLPPAAGVPGLAGDLCCGAAAGSTGRSGSRSPSMRAPACAAGCGPEGRQGPQQGGAVLSAAWCHDHWQQQGTCSDSGPGGRVYLAVLQQAAA